MKKVSIRDVAKDVGVSITTVSRALNGYSDVSEKTRAKIFEAAERLNYAPDVNARIMGGKADKTIALLTSELKIEDENGFVYSLIIGVYQACTELGCEFMLLATDKVKQEKLSFQQLCNKKNLTGVVVTGLKAGDPYYDEIVSSNVPCAMIDMNAHGKRKSRISIDNVEAAKEAVQHLISLGHKHIGMLNASDDIDICGDRYAGYVSALVEAKIPLRLDYLRYCDFKESLAIEKTKELLQSHPEITALFCISDRMAIGAMEAVEELGLRVPEDVSIVGFDDIPLAKYIGKGITTIKQSPIDMGAAGVKVIWQMLNHEKVDKNVVLPHELLVRGTTAKIRPNE